MNPADLSACELVESFAARSLSPVEALEAVLARVEALEPALMALWGEDFDTARAVARASEQRWRKGEPLGPIDGVPTTIKENIASKGFPMPLGTAVPLTWIVAAGEVAVGTTVRETISLATPTA